MSKANTTNEQQTPFGVQFRGSPKNNEIKLIHTVVINTFSKSEQDASHGVSVGKSNLCIIDVANSKKPHGVFPYSMAKVSRAVFPKTLLKIFDRWRIINSR